MSYQRTYRCTECLDSGFRTRFALAHLDGRTMNTTSVTAMFDAKSRGFYEAQQPSTGRCPCGAGAIPQEQKKSTGVDL